MEITIIAELGDAVAKTVVTTVAAAFFIARAAGWNIQFVVGNKYGFGLNFIKIGECGNGLSASIHESAWNKKAEIAALILDSGSFTVEPRFAR